MFIQKYFTVKKKIKIKSAILQKEKENQVEMVLQSRVNVAVRVMDNTVGLLCCQLNILNSSSIYSPENTALKIDDTGWARLICINLCDLDSICCLSSPPPPLYFTWYLHYTEIYIILCPLESFRKTKKRGKKCSLAQKKSQPCLIRFKLHATPGLRKLQWGASRAKTRLKYWK